MRFSLARFCERAVQLVRKPSPLEIYTDGSSKEGLGSWAFLISNPGKPIIEKSGRVRGAGSNAMEFRAAIEALCAIPLNSRVTLFSDSRILIDAMTRGNGPPAYRGQIETLTRLSHNQRVAWQWVKAHHANKFNERCDELCALARGEPLSS